MGVMVEPNEDFDEVALNVLLAEGLDVPTAWEASRCDSSTKPADSYGLGIVVFLIIAQLLMVVF
jgi:hypothetical protein